MNEQTRQIIEKVEKVSPKQVRNDAYYDVLDSLSFKRGEVYWCIVLNAPIAGYEIAKILEMKDGSVSARIKELRDDFNPPYIEACGKKVSKDTNVTVTLYKPTEGQVPLNFD